MSKSMFWLQTALFALFFTPLFVIASLALADRCLTALVAWRKRRQ